MIIRLLEVYFESAICFTFASFLAIESSGESTTKS